MNNNRISELNSILKAMKAEFFKEDIASPSSFSSILKKVKAKISKVSTNRIVSNEIASTYHFLPFDNEEINELLASNYLALLSRFAILNKDRLFSTLLTIGKFVFLDKYTGNFNDDIDFSNAEIRDCLHFLVDASYSAQDFHSCIIYGEKLLKELESSYNPPLDPDKKDILMALTMAYAHTAQYEKSDYYRFLANN